MKTKKLIRKLLLNKMTVSHLEQTPNQMAHARGGYSLECLPETDVSNCGWGLSCIQNSCNAVECGSFDYTCGIAFGCSDWK